MSIDLCALNRDYLIRLIAKEGLMGPWETVPVALAAEVADDAVRAWVRRWLIVPHRPSPEDVLCGDGGPLGQPGQNVGQPGQVAVLLAETSDPANRWYAASGMDSDGFWGEPTQDEAMARAPARVEMDRPAVDAAPDPAFVEAVLAYQRTMRW